MEKNIAHEMSDARQTSYHATMVGRQDEPVLL